MNRKIESGVSRGEPVAVPGSAELRAWIAKQAQERGLRWLLAYLDDGVIWGELRDGKLHLSSDVFGPESLELVDETLQQARLFGEQGELRVWRGPNGLQAFALQDGDGEGAEPAKWIDEPYLLWGWALDTSEVRDGFIELIEGAQGIRHCPPLDSKPSEQQRAELRVRHYLHEDDDGAARIGKSRLLEVVDSREP